MIAIDFPRPVRILQLRLAEDAERVRRQLHFAGLAFMVHCVDTLEAFEKSLREFRPDVAIADASLPRYAARTALDLAQARPARVPVIFVGATPQDGGAIELIRAGAADYVTRDGLAWLGIAIARTLPRPPRARDRGFSENPRGFPAVARAMHA